MGSDSYRGGRRHYAVVLPLVGILAVHPEEEWKGQSALKINRGKEFSQFVDGDHLDLNLS